MKRKDAAVVANPPYQAFRELIYRYGVAEMAALMGYKTGTLYNKADADADSHHQPTLRDVMLATELSGDHSVLDSLDEMFGRAAYDVRYHGETSDEALLELVTKLATENGEFHAALHAALIDKKFSRQDLNLIRSEAFDLVSAVMTLVHRVEELVDE